LSLNKILSEVGSRLKAKNMLRERMLKDARRTLKLSKECVLLIQRGKLKTAKRKLKSAELLLKKTIKLLEDSPELRHGGAMHEACQEYAEACILLRLEEDGKFLTPQEVGVDFQAYLLGLADTVGELRRMVLSRLMAGDMAEAERRFKLMEEIYYGISTLDEQVYSVVSGLRRKCDVARHLLELTGSDVMVEARQRRLEKVLKALEKYSKPRRKR
jgi:translin